MSVRRNLQEQPRTLPASVETTTKGFTPITGVHSVEVAIDLQLMRPTPALVPAARPSVRRPFWFTGQ
ncbi:hypothetical protein [Rhodococcoides fascians]|uniref:hypothetical protein n=1 Tax=Rhodococcoides fascians TaxID=1828 RepID=UPI001C91255C|nr:hypothetical protein [Rhodococcus fascians]MBY4402365.1 hypothetical protein [Rhodococcus fascians]MBY4417277.1 hypothetical protein [Rhodococcus fascians]